MRAPVQAVLEEALHLKCESICTVAEVTAS